MTSRFSVGATMYSAPASNTARAVSASRTVPAPSNKRSPSAWRTWRITSSALGTERVISTTLTPPSARARATSTSCWLSGDRTTATMPQSSTCRSWASLLMLLLFDERLRLHDRVLFREGVKGVQQQAACASLDGDKAEWGHRQAVVGLKIVQEAALAAVGQDLVVDVQKDLGRQHLDLEAD